MSTLIESIERREARNKVPDFRPGDRVRVHFQVIEGTRRRTQIFEGVVLKRQGAGARETFTVRKQSFGVGVERTFPVHSPKVEQVEIAGRGDVRRAKLYYLRGRVGRRARVRERQWAGPNELAAAEEAAAADLEGTQAEAELAEAPPEQPKEDGGDEQAAESQPEAEAAEPEASSDPAPEAEAGDDEAERA